MNRVSAFALGLCLVFGGGAQAAPCRDGAGKFISCPKAAPAKCRDAKGKFVKCSTVASHG